MIEKIKGSWAGPLKVGAAELTVVINITANEKDSLIVTIDSPDQSVNGIATSKVRVTGDSLIVKSKVLKATYKGAFGSDFTELKGTWTQSFTEFPLNLHHSFEKYSVKRPQEPKPPYPYIEKEVVIKNEKAGVDLAGTLTLPEQGGPFPAVILITGSGTQNRDEEMMGHKPFLLLADYLTRRGIAVLRCDDRGFGKSTGTMNAGTTLDFVSDVVAEFNFLKMQKEIDTTRIGLAGHSEGGLIAPIVASKQKDVAFIILLAGPGVTGEQILLLQTALLNRKAGLSEKDIEFEAKLRTKIYTAIRKNNDNEKAAKQIKLILKSAKKKNPDGNGLVKITDQQADLFIQQCTTPWFRMFLVLDPVDYLSQTKCPVLALNGSLDLQVPAKENLKAIEKALIYGGNSQYTIEEIPGLNHLFQHATTGNIDEYGKIEETMSPEVLEKVADWISKIAKSEIVKSSVSLCVFSV
ncbi:MAG: alpha/beta fold hydrolase [Bacteroidetes bacterium]|nr:alpha/beta fold hydrolase [Bacteroidota bacterium]